MKNKTKIILIVIITIILSLIILLGLLNNEERIYISYKDFYNELVNENISSAVIDNSFVSLKKKMIILNFIRIILILKILRKIYYCKGYKWKLIQQKKYLYLYWT